MALTEKTKSYIARECPVDLSGKTVMITGANSGIGYKTAEIMVWMGARVIMACRNMDKARAARNALQGEYPGADIRVMRLDLSDFDSIDGFVTELDRADVIVNNAGLLSQPNEKTRQGFDMVMGTNYLGMYYLTEKLIKKLPADTVYINTTSIAHKIARVDLSRFHESKGAYPRSKLCIARYTNHLAARGVNAYLNHPGMAVTPIAAHIVGPLYRLARFVPVNSAEKSALSAAWILTHDVKPGSIVGPRGFLNGWGYPSVNKPSKRAVRGIDELIRFTENEIRRVRV